MNNSSWDEEMTTTLLDEGRKRMCVSFEERLFHARNETQREKSK